jgi:hypothetical protein
MEKETNRQNLTPEQLQELKDAQIAIMTDQLPALRIQEEYTRLKASIAENVFNEQLNKVKFAQLQNPQMMKSPDKKGSDFDIDKESK